MSSSILDPRSLERALATRDLTDPAQGPHAIQLLLDAITGELTSAWGTATRIERGSPVVSVADNYDHLRYPPGGAVRDARYSRYVTTTTLLRTQTSAMIPPLLRRLPRDGVLDALLACPGVVYRRDVIDRLHTGEPHQLDLWRIRRGPPLSTSDLSLMISLVVSAALPGRRVRTSSAVHPYTLDGLQIDVSDGDAWVEIGECGLAHPDVLAAAGLDPRTTSGLAMGLGLDRLLMLRKGLDDIRLLRCPDPRVAGQLLSLAPYVPVSRMPPVTRDLSLVLDDAPDPEELGDRVRAALGADSDRVESVSVLASHAPDTLSPTIADRLGLAPGQWNVLLRVVLRALDRTLTRAECDALRDRVYAALHRGSRWYWAAGDPRV